LPIETITVEQGRLDEVFTLLTAGNKEEEAA